MDNNQLDNVFNNTVPITDTEEEPEKILDLAGFQVTKAELFAHTYEPAVTIWGSKVKFNMACLRKFPGVTHIQILIHPEQKRMIIRPCDPEAPDSLRWARGGGDKDLANRDLLCRIFAAKVFELMQWDTQYRYKIIGKPATYQNEMLFLFKLSDFELFINNSKNRKSYLPREWRDYFGIPVENHEDSYKIDLADGYITTEKV